MEIDKALFDRLWRDTEGGCVPAPASVAKLSREILGLDEEELADVLWDEEPIHGIDTVKAAYSRTDFDAWFNPDKIDAPDGWDPSSSDPPPRPLIEAFLREQLENAYFDADIHPVIAIVRVQGKKPDRELWAAVEVRGYSFSGVSYEVDDVARSRESLCARLKYEDADQDFSLLTGDQLIEMFWES